MATFATENSMHYLLPTDRTSQILENEEVDEQVNKQILFPQSNLVLFKYLIITTYMTLLRKFSVCNIYQES